MVEPTQLKKYARQIESFPQGGVNIKKTFLKPPPIVVYRRTVDGSEISNNHLTCIEPCKKNQIFTISTGAGFFRILTCIMIPSLSLVIPSNTSEVFGVTIVLVSNTFLPRFL